MTFVQQVNPTPKIQGIPLSSVANIQPVPVTGSKFQYVRLVTTPATQTQTSLGKPRAEYSPSPFPGVWDSESVLMDKGGVDSQGQF